MSTPGGVKARHATRHSALAQKRLLNAVDHGWKPTRESLSATARRLMAEDGPETPELPKKPDREKTAEELFNDNVKLAYWMAGQYARSHPSVDAEDANQEALAALANAARMFDRTRGGKFSGYAGAAISNTLGKMGWRKRIRGTPLGRVDLDAPLGDEEGGDEDMHSMVADQSEDPAQKYARAHDDAALRNQVRSEVANLGKREREMLTAWIAGQTYREIAVDHGVSFVYVGKIIQNALAKLRAKIPRHESRDDLAAGKVHLGPQARRYARMTSRDAMAGRKPQMYMDMAAEVTGQKSRQHGFANQSQGEETGGSPVKKTRAGESLARLLGVVG